MIILYNLIIFIPLIIAVPILFFKLGKKELLQRLGFYIPAAKKCVWFHAASVGEFNAIKPLILEFKKKYDFDLLVTTTTLTGLKEAKKQNLKGTLLPIDFYPIIARFVKKINPQILIIAETEIWPNLYLAMKNRNLVIVNGRISEKTFKRYMILSPILKNIFKSVNLVCAQSSADATRFEKLNFSNVKNVGNLKFAITLPPIDKDKVRKDWGFSEDDFIIVWGSTRPGEEALFISIYEKLKREIENLKLIIAPRHLTRLDEVKRILPHYRLLSKGNSNILLIDKMGILTRAYSISDIAIIGGSFYDFGGHNPLEAVYYNVPVIIGNFHSSCRDTVKILSRNDGIIISDKNSLYKSILSLYENKKLRNNLAQSAFNSLKENSNSLGKNLNCISAFLEKK